MDNHRIASVLDNLAAQGLSQLLVCDPRSIQYLTGAYVEPGERFLGLLLRAGETVPVHEFHYWDSTENGAAFNAQKPATGRSWTCGFAGPALYAAFPHLYFAGRPQLAERFVRAAAAFQSGR